MTNPDRLPLSSLDLAEDRKALLRKSFPEVFREDKIDFDALQRALGEWVDPGKERFGLNWPGKAACSKLIQQASVGTLLPMRGQSVDFDSTENLIIEGDNLEVLKLLQKSYYGKVKMIYIDPPYNTGNEFIYPDNFHEGLQDYLKYSGQVDGEGRKQSSNSETGGRYHSNWLSMMYPRLFLARNLLREDGVIFVSIDDNEVHNLRALMNEIFGEENFLVQLIWEKTRKNDARFFSIGHDYIVAFAKNVSFLKEQNIYFREEKLGAKEIQTEYLRLREKYGSNNKIIQKEIRDFYSRLPRNHPAKKHSRYGNIDDLGVWRDDNMSWPGGGGPNYEVIHPVTGIACAVPDGGWRYSTSQKMQEMIEKGTVVFREDHSEPPIRKTYLVRTIGSSGEDDCDESEEQDVGIQVMGSVFYKSAQPASKLLNELFGTKIFDNPKDHEVIARMIRYCANSDDIILDFFAGSGTTAHAVMELNQEDNGKRKFILVQLPEPTDNPAYPTIADITRERVRRVSARLKAAPTAPDLLSAAAANAAPDLGFKAMRLASSNFKVWDGRADQMTDVGATLQMFAEHVLPGRTAEDILHELLLICLEHELSLAAIEAMVARDPWLILCLDAGFAGQDQLKANAMQTVRAHNRNRQSSMSLKVV